MRPLHENRKITIQLTRQFRVSLLKEINKACFFETKVISPSYDKIQELFKFEKKPVFRVPN